MDDPADVYCDQFQLNTNPYGATLIFGLTSSNLPGPGQPPRVDQKAVVRMSLEHLKSLVFIARRQILQYERTTGISIPVPLEVLNALGISPEDWETLWRQ
jgi:hypothetical protein